MKKQLLLLTLATYCAVANSGTGTSKQADAKSAAALLRQGFEEQALQQDPQALIKASEKGDLAQVKALIAAGAQIHVRDKHGWTPLHLAAIQGHLAVAQELIAAGAQLNIRVHDYNALQVAAIWEHLEVVQALVIAGADIDEVKINQLGNSEDVWKTINEALKDRKWSHEF